MSADIDSHNQNLDDLCIHTITTKPWSLTEAIAHYASAGMKGITVWRDALHGWKPRDAGKAIRDKNLKVVSLCRGGFFPDPTPKGRRHAIDENKRIIDEARELGAPLVVLVCGAVPGQPLAESRKQISDGIHACVEHAADSGVKLGIEPLHPMYADTRSAVNTLKQANDITEQISSPWVGVIVDVYHLWWDPELEQEILRSGDGNRIFAYHISDWKSPTTDLLNDRGIMGEGCIPIRSIRGWMENAGFRSFQEVEIFSTVWWAQDQEVFLRKIIEAYRRFA